MRKAAQILLFLLGTIHLSCSNKLPFDDGSRVQNQCETISAETSTLIAKGELFLDYDLKDYEVSIKDGDTYREVHFLSQCESCHGGDPYVHVDKTTGKVLKSYTPK